MALLRLLLPLLGCHLAPVAAVARPSEVWTTEQECAAGVITEHVTTPQPKDYVDVSALPASFSYAALPGCCLTLLVTGPLGRTTSAPCHLLLSSAG
jgi:hypothetical protein